MATMSYMPDMAGYKKSCRSRHVLKPFFVMFQPRIIRNTWQLRFYQYGLESSQPVQAQITILLKLFVLFLYQMLEFQYSEVDFNGGFSIRGL